jgi:hypothetical protein
MIRNWRKRRRSYEPSAETNRAKRRKRQREHGSNDCIPTKRRERS